MDIHTCIYGLYWPYGPVICQICLNECVVYLCQGVFNLPIFQLSELMFLETSALTGENVEETFLKCARSILTKIESGKCGICIIE